VAKNLNIVGKPFRKVDARAKCVGQTKFADDIVLPRMLFCKILRSHLPHALIKGIDVSKALALPGVFAVVTGKDFPIPYGILPVSQDEHALCVDKVRFIGDPVAAVAAIDEDVAFDAMNLIEVEYEPLNTISTIEEAVLIEEPRIHDYGDGGNVHKKVSLEFGNLEEGLSDDANASRNATIELPREWQQHNWRSVWPGANFNQQRGVIYVGLDQARSAQLVSEGPR